MAEEATSEAKKDELPECFVMMPIGEKKKEGRSDDHFRRVYEDIFQPACKMAGFAATRADDKKTSDIIHVSLLRSLIQSPMAICDLTDHNPNVLFELGLRQAFDLPIVLVAEQGTGPIFDTDIIRHHVYRPARLYHEVKKDQEAIAAKLIAMREATTSSKPNESSLIRLLGIGNVAKLPSDSAPAETMQYLVNLIERIGSDVSILMAERTSVRQMRRAEKHIAPLSEATTDIDQAAMFRFSKMVADKAGIDRSYLINHLLKTMPTVAEASKVLSEILHVSSSTEDLRNNLSIRLGIPFI